MARPRINPVQEETDSNDSCGDILPDTPDTDSSGDEGVTKPMPLTAGPDPVTSWAVQTGTGIPINTTYPMQTGTPEVIYSSSPYVMPGAASVSAMHQHWDANDPTVSTSGRQPQIGGSIDSQGGRFTRLVQLQPADSARAHSISGGQEKGSLRPRAFEQLLGQRGHRICQSSG